MNRETLAQWSASLTDDEFPQALAALGVLVGLAQKEPERLYGANGWRIDALPERFKAAVETGAGILCWEPPTVSSATNEPQIPLAPSRARGVMASPEAKVLAAVWRDFLKQLANSATAPRSGPRLSIQTEKKAFAQAANIAALLAHPQVGATSVHLTPKDFFASMAATDWRWPFTVATFPDDPLTEFLTQSQQALARQSLFRLVTPTPQERQVDILVSGAGADAMVKRLDALESRLRCRLLIVTGFQTIPFPNLASFLKKLAARTSAAGIAVLRAVDSTRQLAERLYLLFARLTLQKSLDEAFAEVFQPREMLLILRRDFLALDAKESDYLRVSRHLPQAVPQSSSVPPTPISTDGSTANRSVPEVTNPVLRKARYVQLQSFRQQNGDFIRERSYYLIGQPISIVLFIAEKQTDATAAPQAFPDDLLPDNEKEHQLEVVFYEPRQFDQPMFAAIRLPREGRSTNATFTFTPRQDGAFEGRIWIAHRNRILQICVLRTQVFRDQHAVSAASQITLDILPVRSDWSDLGKRRPYDLALEISCFSPEKPMLAGITGQRAWSINLDTMKEPIRKINDLISGVAYNVADYGEGLDQGKNPKLLVSLARRGAEIYSVLKEQLHPMMAHPHNAGDSSIPHLQVVSTYPDTVILLEFIYDFEPPERTATVCPQYREALKNGHCSTSCPRFSTPEKYVCPMGFWGLSKVIERHLYDPQKMPSPGAELALMAEPVEGRNRLSLRSGTVLGYSQEVKPEAIKALIEKLQLDALVVKDWDEWKQAVQAKHPGLLVAFPHNEIDGSDIFLEIGGKELDTLRLKADYVRASDASAPLVFLLGCDVAGTGSTDLANHIRSFRQGGAAVIVSTVATVFYAHAVKMGEAILSRLLDLSASDSMTIGDAIREAKCAALSESLPMALCVTAFGDADWRL